MALPLFLAMASSLAPPTNLTTPVPVVPLLNAARPNMTMPAIGLGTGGYGVDPNLTMPECWAEFPSKQDGAGACGPLVEKAVVDWLTLGGKRLDSSNSYSNQKAVGIGMKQSGKSRDDMWLLSKIGSTNPMGYNETLWQAAQILKDLQVDELDVLLVHWPTSTPSPINGTNTTDPYCHTGEHGFEADPVACRLSVWRAMLKLWGEGKVRAVGVANYNVSHIEEIKAAGLPLPSVIQIPFNPSLGQVQSELRTYCQQHGIVVLAYSPLGIPDLPHVRPTKGTLLEEPAILKIADRHKKSAAQVILRWAWQQGVPSNPRSVKPSHMRENLGIYDAGFVLSVEDMAAITGLPQDLCARTQANVSFYECFPQWLHYPPGNTIH